MKLTATTSFRTLLLIGFCNAALGCGADSDSLAGDTAERAQSIEALGHIPLLDLDGEVRDVAQGALSFDGRQLRWETTVDGVPHAIVSDDGSQGTLQVFGPQGETLFQVHFGQNGRLLGATAAGEQGFDVAQPMPSPEDMAQVSTDIALVDGAYALPQELGLERLFAPMAQAGYAVAVPLALAALPVALERQGRTQHEGDLATIEAPLVPYILGGAAAGALLGAAYCLRSSTSASCSLGDGTKVGITCNACQGTASCTRTVSSGSSGNNSQIILGADDAGSEGSTVTCSCSCK